MFSKAGAARTVMLQMVQANCQLMVICSIPQLCPSRCIALIAAGVKTEAMLQMVQAKGAGYAMSRQNELETMQQVAHATGLSLSLSYCRYLAHQCMRGLHTEVDSMLHVPMLRNVTS